MTRYYFGFKIGRQQHTLDMELFGLSAWLRGFYLLALFCGAEMERHLSDEKRANHYMKLYERGKAWTNTHLFNGRYFCQSVELSDRSLVDRFDAADDLPIYRIAVLGEPLTLRSVAIPNAQSVTSVTADGVPIDFACVNGEVEFGDKVISRELCLR